jgi:hypothetical protein
MAAYNFARRLKTLSGLTPYEYIAKVWTSEPDRFIVNPIQQMPGLNKDHVPWFRGDGSESSRTYGSHSCQHLVEPDGDRQGGARQEGRAVDEPHRAVHIGALYGQC